MFTVTVFVCAAILKKLYDMFTKSDSGVIDVADAGLTADEFAHSITVKYVHTDATV